MKMSDSNSKVQQSIERVVLDKFNNKKGWNLKPQEIQLTNDKASVQLDGFDEEKKIICEIYAHVGKLIGSQPSKVASDFLKMLLVEKTKKCQMKKYFIFVDEQAAKHVKGKSWLSCAKKKFKIKIEVIELPKELKESIERAQKGQNLLYQKAKGDI